MLTDASHFIYSVDDSPHPPAIKVEVLVRWRSLKMKKQTCETCLSMMSWIFLDCIKSKGGLWEWLWFAGQDPRRLWSPSAVLGGAGRDEGTSLSLHPTVRWQSAELPEPNPVSAARADSQVGTEQRWICCALEWWALLGYFCDTARLVLCIIFPCFLCCSLLQTKSLVNM